MRMGRWPRLAPIMDPQPRAFAEGLLLAGLEI